MGGAEGGGKREGQYRWGGGGRGRGCTGGSKECTLFSN